MTSTRVKSIIAAAVALALAPGCAATWGGTQLAGTQRIWDEDVREEVVPLPGVKEHLIVELPLAINYPPAPVSATGAPVSSTAAPAAKPLPFALSCTTQQRARNATYRQAFRYGSRWKKGTAAFAFLEGVIAAAILVERDPDSETADQNLILGAVLAADAVVTAALFFAPRKEIYRRDEVGVTTTLRRDCPEGLALEIAGEAFPVDAAGRVDELAELALADWMAAPTGSLRVVLAEHAAELPITADARCSWAYYHPQPDATEQAPACGFGSLRPRVALTTLTVELGTLSRIE